MRVVVVNHMHPSVAHVSGMRAWHFARELVSRGHQVMLLCERNGLGQAEPEEADVRTRVRAHDWKTPLVVAVRPASVPALDAVRSVETNKWRRKAMVAWSYARHSGMFSDFSRGAAPHLADIAEGFKPHVVWGIFGNTDCWLLAQRLATLAGCRWVGDMKDAWDVWIPRGVRRLVARRFGDIAASTANSRFNADVLQSWFQTQSEVVYSGVDETWIQPPSPPAEGFPVVMMGATYDNKTLTRFVHGFGEWLKDLPVAERDRVRFCYAGSDTVRVESALRGLQVPIQVDVRGYLPPVELAALCRTAAVNVYLWSPSTFHHKVVELLCCQRPIISFPGERAESEALSRQVGGSLNVCGSERQLKEAFNQALNGVLRHSGGPERLEPLTWTSRATRLEAVLSRVAKESMCAP